MGLHREKQKKNSKLLPGSVDFFVSDFSAAQSIQLPGCGPKVRYAPLRGKKGG